jgi:thiamine biosynthesis lipoprotein
VSQLTRRIQQSRYLLGSEVILTLVGQNLAELEKIMAELWTEIQIFEASFSRFKASSELTGVNHQAGQRTAVSQEFVALAEAAKQWSLNTGGLYNPFILPALQAAGYQGSWPTVDSYDPATNYVNRQLVAATQLQVGDTWVEIPPATALDFGGIGKGYLLDQLVAQLPPVIEGYWFSLGGDVICGGYDLQQRPWSVSIQKANATGILGSVANSTGQPLAIATSGTTKRRGISWHHLIDPRTGHPAYTDVLSATVTATSAVAADIQAKCLVIVGSKMARQFTTVHAIQNSVLQYKDQDGSIRVDKTGEIDIP